ncbi:response regulator transcription factor [Burkholderia cenocepacia]|uniref:response regulator transcription factor n=1 Tax=Burkholderia cenocepacia TaxID=95486 RepID=UPI001902D922|nr:response regulator transcription factor [Burkholderia cenocepacia]MBJ9697686.1 response regulator transcription factor [Burkholderia cenocepacia]MCA8251562.1 response regulator transcription factor [Burkholderia multivorans]
MQNFTAMILDDHYLIRHGFATVAQNIPGLSLIGTYERSRDLIAAMELHQPRILFIDFILHVDDMDGLTLIRLIKRRFSDVKIIVISAHAKAGIVSLALKAGADGFCSKGTSVAELTTATNRILSGRSYVPDSHLALIGGFIEVNCVRGENIKKSSALEMLTSREREVINLFLMGMSITDISKKISRDRKTISGHKQSAYRKLGISSDAELFSIRHLLE